MWQKILNTPLLCSSLRVISTTSFYFLSSFLSLAINLQSLLQSPVSFSSLSLLFLLLRTSNRRRGTGQVGSWKVRTQLFDIQITRHTVRAVLHLFDFNTETIAAFITCCFPALLCTNKQTLHYPTLFYSSYAEFLPIYISTSPSSSSSSSHSSSHSHPCHCSPFFSVPIGIS